MDSHVLAAMPHRTLGKTGINVSLLGYGAEPLGRVGRTYEDAEKTLHAVIDAGATVIDTASAYGNSEEFIGRALAERHRKSEFTLVTKCGWVNPDYSAAWSPAEIAATIDESLRRLRTEIIDILLLHSCDLDLLKRGEVITAIKKARDQGKAKFIGYSGDNEALKFAIECDAFNVIECSFSMLDQANGHAIELASERGIGVMIKRPIANAVPGAATRPRSEYAAQYWPRWQAIGLNERDVDGLPLIEAAMRFSAYRRGVDCVLIGSSHADHMRDNVRMLSHGPLPSSIIDRIVAAYVRVGSNWPALG